MRPRTARKTDGGLDDGSRTGRTSDGDCEMTRRILDVAVADPAPRAARQKAAHFHGNHGLRGESLKKNDLTSVNAAPRA